MRLPQKCFDETELQIVRWCWFALARWSGLLESSRMLHGTSWRIMAHHGTSWHIMALYPSNSKHASSLPSQCPCLNCVDRARPSPANYNWLVAADQAGCGWTLLLDVTHSSRNALPGSDRVTDDVCHDARHVFSASGGLQVATRRHWRLFLVFFFLVESSVYHQSWGLEMPKTRA